MKVIKTSKYEDKIKGGKADKKTPSDFPKKDIDKGRDIELEHTNDKEIAKEIAIDHLKEHKDYYNDKNGLPAMEKGLKKTKK